MWQDTKLLITVSTFIIITGFGFLWFGLKPTTPILSPTPTPQAEQPIIQESTSSGIIGISGERMLVTEVVDGDTIQINGDQTVRFIGIDTPETKDPRRPVGCFGKEASNKTKELLFGKEVILQKDVSETDKYQRILRYVFLPLEDGTILFVNDYLVREGFATVYTYPPDVKYEERLRKAEKEAKENKRGLWGRC